MKIKELLKKLVTAHTSPREIALGVAVGVFIGFMPVYGLHTVLFVIFAFLIRPANKLAILIGTNISLPPTVPFITWIGYSIGRLILKGNYPALSWSMLKDFSYHDLLRLYYPLFIGSAIAGIVVSIFFYCLTYLIVKYRYSRIKKSCN